MAKNFSGEVLHFGGIILRVTGTGNFQSSLHSLNDMFSDTMAALSMGPSTDVEPWLWANFTSQRAFYKFNVNAINESFVISKIVIYVAPVFVGYPR